jgi:site-specific recombinase XerD
MKKQPLIVRVENMELEEYKNYLIAKGYAKDTREGMIKTTCKFLGWIDTQGIEITTINYNDITAYIKINQERKITARTTQLIVIHVKHYLNYLVEAGTLSNNPALALKIKNTKKKTVYNILSPEELETIYKEYRTELPHNPKAPPQTLNRLGRKRNKVLLGLLIYQGISAEDIKNIELKHLELREGKITIPGSRRSNERILKLEAHQIFDLYDYVNEIRKDILRVSKKESTALFVTTGSSHTLQNMVQNFLKEITQQNRNVKNLDQLRASIITNWLKQYNKRKVQYMAGHRYVSSTEAYEANNIELLQEDLQKYYPQL